ncbi:MAG: ABC transporter ATP-binding protein [Desulfatiglandaceae bacterium]|jgi:branched-chain amino acid transport system ATP-binding protein
MLLEVREINTFYGISHILFDVSLEIDKGEVVCILGRNGVGKTTTLRSIIGLTPPRSGSIVFLGVEIRGKQPFEIARLGIGFVPEDRIIFPDLTVRENLEMGIKRKDRGGWPLERVYEMFPLLKEREKQMGGTLSGGEQQMLTIARTLMGNPQLLLLDEPSEGLAPMIVKEVENQVRHLKTEGMPILLSEQNSNFIMKLSDRAYILEKGQIRWKGEVSELKDKPEIMKTYLGI